jgi:hypothetical protein
MTTYIKDLEPILGRAEQEAIVSENKVVAELRDKITKSEETIAKQLERKAAAEAEASRIEDKMADLRGEMRALESALGVARGEKSGATHHIRLSERRISEIRSRIGHFVKKILLSEGERRIRSMGKTIRMNVGKRSKGGGAMFDIVNIEDVRARDNDPGSGASIKEYREANGIEYDRNAVKVEEPFFPE